MRGTAEYPGRDGKKQDLLERIWQRPTGPLALLPIHAAGIYDDGLGEHCQTPPLHLTSPRWKHMYTVHFSH
jgi:hypothetical protein